MRSEAKNALFSAEAIQKPQADYVHPVADVSKLLDGRSYVCGAGLDRAKSLIQTKTSDATVWVIVAKTVGADGQAEYYVLHMKYFRVNLSKAIKSIIADQEQSIQIRP